MSARRIKKPKMAKTVVALDQLVSQFAQPLAFLRELVQNSLDASTELIEVEVGYDAEAGCCFVRVRDTGTGMDRHIIDTKLTRLFSSTKDNDFTKIGKFGIGFVSIFAVRPKLVVLETGRDGEAWRLLFKPDRSFERRELSAPVEGTCVTVFVPRGRQELPSLQTDCRDTVAFWCRHSEVEIQFNGTPINEPFELPQSEFSYRHSVEGTEVVVAPSREPIGFHGYYNRGLTLLEGTGSPLPHVSFKLRSRYLEHTLSRDNILFDEHYDKAMAEVRRAAFCDMPVALLEELSGQDSPALWELACLVLAYPEPAPSAFSKVAVFPSNGRRLKLSQLGDPVYVHPQVDDLWRAVEAAGHTIVLAEEGDHVCALLAKLAKTTKALTSSFVFFRPVDTLPAKETLFFEALRRADRSLHQLVIIVAVSAPTSWKDRFCAHLPSKGRVILARPGVEPEQGGPIGVFGSHRFWSKLVALYEVQPELAVALGFRRICLELGLGTGREGKLFGRLVASLQSREATA